MEFTLEQLKEIIGSSVSKAVQEQWAAADAKAREGEVERKHAAGLLEGGASDEGQGEQGRFGRGGTEKGLNAARYIKYMLQGRQDPDRAAKLAKAAGHEAVSKALSASSMTGGGFMLPPQFSDEVIDLLYPATVVRRMGVSTMPMEGGSLTLPYLATGTTATYVGENQTAGVSQLSGGQLQLSDKKLAIVTPVSNDLLRINSAKADAVIRNNLVAQMAIKEDVTFIRSDGTSGTPKGMLFWADAANKFAANASVSLANVTNDLGNAIFLLENANVMFKNPGWLFSPRTKKYLMTVRDGNGNLVFQPEMKTGTLMGYPFAVSQQIPNNTGAGSSSEVYFVNFADLVIAERSALIMDVFPGASYVDAGGNTVSGVQNDQTLLRTLAMHDFGAQYRGKEIAVITAVNWT